MDIGALVGKLIRAAIGITAIAVAAPAYGQFGNLRPITELNSSEGDSHAVVSRDNLRCFFASDRLSPVVRDRDVFSASRTTDTQPFVIQGPVPNINNMPYPDQPSFLSADELTLYLTTNSGNWDITTATRPTMLLPFNAPVPITELDDQDNQLNATVLFNGLELYLEYFPNAGGNNKIMRSTRSSTSLPWDVPSIVNELNASKYQVSPVLYANGLQITFGCDMRIPNDIDICYSQRRSINDPWEAPVVLSSISSTGYADTPSAFVGNDPQRTLYFFSDRPGGMGNEDIYAVDIVCGELGIPKEIGTMHLIKDQLVPGQLKAVTASNPGCVNAYNVYENDMGSFSSTNQLACDIVGLPFGTDMEILFSPSKPSQFYVMTSSNLIGESPSGSIPSPQSCGPF